MPKQNFFRDVDLADILAEIKKEQIAKRAGKTSGESLTQNTIIQFLNSINMTNSFTNTELGLIFKCTNDAGGGVTPTTQRGIIGSSCISEPNGAQIGAETSDGYGAGVHQPGICDTSELM